MKACDADAAKGPTHVDCIALKAAHTAAVKAQTTAKIVQLADKTGSHLPVNAEVKGIELDLAVAYYTSSKKLWEDCFKITTTGVMCDFEFEDSFVGLKAKEEAIKQRVIATQLAKVEAAKIVKKEK